MNETEMFSAIGKKQVELDNLNAEYDRLLAVLAQVALTQISIDRVTVDLAARTWTVQSIAEPAVRPEAETVQ